MAKVLLSVKTEEGDNMILWTDGMVNFDGDTCCSWPATTHIEEYRKLVEQWDYYQETGDEG